MPRLRRTAHALPDAPIVQHSIITWEKDHVRASVVECSEGTAELLGVAAAPVHGIGRASHPDVDRWSIGCNQALTQAEDMTLNVSGRKIVPNDVFMSVPAEVARSFPLTVSHQRRHPATAITMDEFRALLQRGYRKAQDMIGEGDRDMRQDLVHGTVAEITLDGQLVDAPVGLHGEQLVLGMSFCVAPLEWIRALEIVAERLRLRLMAIVPQSVAFVSALEDAAALLILLDECHTYVGLARRGRLQWASLVETGEREIVSATAEALQLRGRQADALMRAYRAKQLRDDVELELARSFWLELRRWMSMLAGNLRGVPNVSLAHRVYFLDMTRRLPEALPSLATPFWEQSLPFARCPEIQEFDIRCVRDVLDCTAQAGDIACLALRALACYVARLHSPAYAWERLMAEMIRGWKPAALSRFR